MHGWPWYVINWSVCFQNDHLQDASHDFNLETDAFNLQIHLHANKTNISMQIITAPPLKYSTICSCIFIKYFESLCYIKMSKLIFGYHFSLHWQSEIWSWWQCGQLDGKSRTDQISSNPLHMSRLITADDALRFLQSDLSVARPRRLSLAFRNTCHQPCLSAPHLRGNHAR